MLIGLALVVVGVIATVIAAGSGTPAPAPSNATPNVTQVCDAVAQVGADYDSLNTNQTVPSLDADLQDLSDKAAAYGDPFSSEFTTAKAAADQGDNLAVISALDTMAGTCKSDGFDG